MKPSATAVLRLAAFASALTPSTLLATEANEALLRELLVKLEERSAVISQLQQRVDALERRLAEGQAPAGAAAPSPAPAPAAPPASTAAGSAQQQVATTPPAGGGPASAPPSGATARPAGAPGTFEVDEEAAERALERTLTAAGALLLAPGRAEIEPNFTFVRREDTVPIVVGGPDLISDLEVRRNDFQFGLDLRVGLPWDTQFEFGLPYAYQQRDIVVPNLESQSTSAQGLGDIRVGLAKTVLREKAWRPDLIARIRWEADTAQTKDDISLGDGYNRLVGSLTAIKRQDPLAFVGNSFYRKTFSSGTLDPGDEFGFSVGVVLAASPETSLQASLLQSFTRESKINGIEIPGSDQTNGVLTLGASSILGRGVLLSITGGIGLTSDAPDYFVGISLPIAFDVPKL